jgi:hypothetical protein
MLCLWTSGVKLNGHHSNPDDLARARTEHHTLLFLGRRTTLAENYSELSMSPNRLSTTEVAEVQWSSAHDL